MKTINQEIESIKESLSLIEEYMAWLITPEQRFRVGQRVEWSRQGKKAGFARRKLNLKGTIKSMSGFSVTVKLDGLKHAQTYHHAFLNSVCGKSLF